MKTKDKILQTAYKLFQNSSYTETSIEDICKNCDLTKPAFYYHFSSKAELLTHYYDDVIQQIYKKINQMNSDNNFWETYVLCFIELIKGSENLGPDLMRELYIYNLTDDKHTFDFNQGFTELCVSLIEQAQKTKQINNLSDPYELYLASAYIFSGTEVFWSVKKGDFNRAKILLNSLNVLFLPTI